MQVSTYVSTAENIQDHTTIVHICSVVPQTMA